MVVRLKGSGLYLAKRGCNEITSSFVATRTNLVPSNSITHEHGGMVSIGSRSVSSLTVYPRGGRPSVLHAPIFFTFNLDAPHKLVPPFSPLKYDNMDIYIYIYIYIYILYIYIYI